MKRSGIHRPKKRSLATVSAGRDGPSVFSNKSCWELLKENSEKLAWDEMWSDEVDKLRYIFGSVCTCGSHPHSEPILQVSTWIDSWTAWHAAPPCHDFFVAQWTRRHLHAMAPGTLQTILYLMINGSAIRVWGMWYDGFFSEPSPILAPKSNASKKWKEQPQLCCWGTFAPTLFHEACRLVEVPQHWNQPVAAAVASTNVGSRGLRNRVSVSNCLKSTLGCYGCRQYFRGGF